MWLDDLDIESCLSPTDRVRQVILDDHTLSNREVSLMARASLAQVEGVRAGLVRRGVIPPSRAACERHEPQYSERPAPPRSLRRGLCINVIPSPWVSDDWAEKQRAIEICRQCPVLDACLDWSLSLPTHDHAIYAGLGSRGRELVRHQRAGRPIPARLTSAGSNAARDRRRAAARREAEAVQQDQAAEGGAA